MFFGLFKKKPDKTQAALKVIPSLIQLQFTLSGWNAESVPLDRWVLGYIFGIHDGFLQALKVKDEAVLGMMAVSYDKVFGSLETGAKIFRQSLDLQRDPNFKIGVAAGGNEAIAFIRNGTPPMELSKRSMPNTK